MTNWPLLIINSHAYGYLIIISYLNQFRVIYSYHFSQIPCVVWITSIINVSIPSWITGRHWLGDIWFLMKYLFIYAPCQGSFRRERNEVSKQRCGAGRHPWAPPGPSSHTAHNPRADGSDLPLHLVTQGSVRPAGSGADWRDSARYFTAVWNMWAVHQHERYRATQSSADVEQGMLASVKTWYFY